MCKDEVQPLAEKEWEESGHYELPLSIDWDQYNYLEEIGKLQFYTARDNDTLIGYVVVVLVEPLTIKDESFAYIDSVYVDHGYRKNFLGKDLFAFVEACLKSDGITRVIASSSCKNPIDTFLESMGYKELETKFDKALL